MAVKFNPITGKYEKVEERPAIGTKERAAIETAKALKIPGQNEISRIAAETKAKEEKRFKTIEGLRELPKRAAKGIAEEFVAKDSPVYNILAGTPTPAPPTAGQKPVVGTPHPLTTVYPATSEAPPIIKTPPTPLAPPTGPTGIAALDQTAPILATGAPTPEAPATIAEPTLWQKAKGGIADIGKWASDPKISRALMQAGLSILATEPRRVPYSDAEMLGKAGITGIAAYDTEVAREAAKAEMARKAGIEEREMKVKERVPTASREVYTEPSPSIKDGKPVRVVRYKDTGGIADVSPLTPQELEKMRKEAKGEGGDATDEKRKFMEKKYFEEYDTSKGNEDLARKAAEKAGAVWDAWEADKEYRPEIEPTQTFLDKWFYGKKEGTKGGYVPRGKGTKEPLTIR